MEYIIHDCWAEQTDDAIEGLESRVKDALSQGWTPMGGVTIINMPLDRNHPGYLVAQAMIRIG